VQQEDYSCFNNTAMNDVLLVEAVQAAADSVDDRADGALGGAVDLGVGSG